MNVTDLGFTPEELRALVIERAADKLCSEVLGADMADYAEEAVSTVERKVKAHVDQAIKPAIDEAITKTLEPFVQGQLEQIVFQKTNEWGEKSGEPQSFRELLIARAEAWLVEPVNYNGKTKKDDGYNWSMSTTRVAYMVDQHLQYHIKTAMGEALKTANSQISGGIVSAVKVALADVMAGLKVAVTTK